ncbi:MAG TPA: hypothetical protein VNI02_06895, partial [Blastocatellia bacterium]|nr:hypothetical protein [Blastocatellia bacterium]
LSLPLSAQSKKKPRLSQSMISNQVGKAKEEIIRAANEYKASLEKLLVLQEADVKKAAKLVEGRKALFLQNILFKKELEQAERQLAAAQMKVNETRKQIRESDKLIVEAQAAEQLTKQETTSRSKLSLVRRRARKPLVKKRPEGLQRKVWKI